MKPADAAAPRPPVVPPNLSLGFSNEPSPISAGPKRASDGAAVSETVAAQFGKEYGLGHQRAGVESKPSKSRQSVASIAGGRRHFVRQVPKRRYWPSRRLTVPSSNGRGTEPDHRAEYLELAAPKCGIASSNWPPGKSTNAESRGPKPTPTWPRPSISACITPTRSAPRRRTPRATGPERRTLSYRPAGSGGRDRPLELPAGHLHRHDGRRLGNREYSHHEAGRAILGRRLPG